MKVKVKICGIRNHVSAITALEAGADFLGFNFVVESSRFIEPAIAKKIIGDVKRESLNLSRQVKIVGVFQNANADYIKYLAKFLYLDFVQLHDKRIIKSTKNSTTYKLIDRNIQGQGKMLNLNKAYFLARKFPIFFAGGLDSNNIQRVLKKVHPFAVDVAGGIETNGFEDTQKIKTFIANAKEVFI